MKNTHSQSKKYVKCCANLIAKEKYSGNVFYDNLFVLIDVHKILKAKRLFGDFFLLILSKVSCILFPDFL